MTHKFPHFFLQTSVDSLSHITTLDLKHCQVFSIRLSIIMMSGPNPEIESWVKNMPRWPKLNKKGSEVRSLKTIGAFVHRDSSFPSKARSLWARIVTGAEVSIRNDFFWDNGANEKRFGKNFKASFSISLSLLAFTIFYSHKHTHTHTHTDTHTRTYSLVH